MKNKEIGGFLELNCLINKPYHKNAIELNTARNSLVYIIKSRNIKKIYIPFYICSSIDIVKSYCEVEYYDIDEEMLPIFEKNLKKDEYLYIVNYFGMISNKIIIKLKNKYKNIIIDNVQAFFQKPVNKVDTLYSCRKFIGVSDGSYLYTDAVLEEEIKEDQSKDRFTYLLGRLESNAQNYYDQYKENEMKLSTLPLLKMSRTTKSILGAIDYKKVQDARTSNFIFLNNRLKKLNRLKIKNIKGAYAYPLYIENAKNIRKSLIDNDIYVPILWPNVINENRSKKAYDFAENILPLPCDQRYNVEDMEKIIKLIKEQI